MHKSCKTHVTLWVLKLTSRFTRDRNSMMADNHDLFFQATLGYVRVCFRMDTSALWGKWRGLPVGITWPLPALMQPRASGKRRTMILRLDEMPNLHFGICCVFVEFTQSFAMSSRIWPCWKDMKMRSNVLRGHLQGICWQHVAETRVSGSGKVCVNLVSRASNSSKSDLMCTLPCVHGNDLFSCVFHSGWRRWVWVCYRCKLPHARCQAYCVAPNQRGRSYSSHWARIISLFVIPLLFYYVFNMCLHSSWRQPATTTTSVFTRKRMMTGSAGPPWLDTRPLSGVCLLMQLDRGWPPAAMTALWRFGRNIQMKVDRVSC